MGIGGNPLNLGSNPSAGTPITDIVPQTSSWDSFGAAFGRSWNNGLGASIRDYASLNIPGWGLNQGAKVMTGADLEKKFPGMKFGIDPKLKLSQDAAEYIVKRRMEDEYNDRIIQGAQGQFGASVSTFLGSIAGSATDPAFLPFILFGGESAGLLRAGGESLAGLGARSALDAGAVTETSLNLAKGAQALTSAGEFIEGSLGAKVALGATEGAAIGYGAQQAQKYLGPQVGMPTDQSDGLEAALFGAGIGAGAHLLGGLLSKTKLNRASTDLQNAGRQTVADATLAESMGIKADHNQMMARNLQHTAPSLAELETILDNTPEIPPIEVTSDTNPQPKQINIPELVDQNFKPFVHGKPKPRYRNVELEFQSDLDNSLYIIAKRDLLSGADDKFFDFARSSLPGMSDEEILDLAQHVKKTVSDNAKKGISTVSPITKALYQDSLNAATIQHAQAVAEHPATDMVATPGEQAILKASSKQELTEAVQTVAEESVRDKLDTLARTIIDKEGRLLKSRNELASKKADLSALPEGETLPRQQMRGITKAENETIPRQVQELEDLRKQEQDLRQQIVAAGEKEVGFTGTEQIDSETALALGKPESEGELLYRVKNQLLNEIGGRVQQLKQFISNVDPITYTSKADLADNRFMQEMNELMAKDSQLDPEKFLADKVSQLEEQINKAKSLPTWTEDTEFGRKTVDRLNKLEEQFKDDQTRFKDFQTAVAQAQLCAMEGFGGE